MAPRPWDPERAALLAQLGKHKAAKGCVYIRRMADVDLAVLRQMVAASARDTRQRYP